MTILHAVNDTRRKSLKGSTTLLMRSRRSAFGVKKYNFYFLCSLNLV